jgi:hypothetical protein
MIWDATSLASNNNFLFNTCLEQNLCADLKILDSYGDGILPPGGMTLAVDGVSVWQGGNIENGIMFQIGEGCN